MNRRLLLPAVVVSVSIGALFPAVADEPTSAALMQTLPHDGAWATYNVNVMVNDQEFIMSATARLVGQATYGGKLCRFIEYEQTVAAPPAIDVPQLGNLTWRLLVPEEEFGEGKDPLAKAEKKWVKYDRMEPEAVESIELRDPIFAILFQGPKKNLKIEDAKEKVNWQRGQLECQVVSGQNELEIGGAKLDVMHRIFRHPDVPFGVAGMQQEMKATFGGQEVKVTLRASLRDHGKEAKAKLPELAY
ncbi:MAG: hypothetical protein WEB58_19425 [Planctomycetaceae bacterium]